MSDIHGCMKAYREMLRKINFTSSDTLYIIGDVVDRGPDGIGVLLDIISRPNVTMLLGNHELMMLNAMSAMTNLKDNELCPELELWAMNGCAPTLDGLDRLSEKEAAKLFEYLEDLMPKTDVTVGEKTYHLVHGAPGGTGATEYDLVWSRIDKNAPAFFTDRTVISGHTPTPYYNDDGSAKIWYGNGCIIIDCGCFVQSIPGKLACLRLDDMKEFYTSQWV